METAPPVERPPAKRRGRPPFATVVITGIVATAGVRTARWFADRQLGPLLGWVVVFGGIALVVGAVRGHARWRRARGVDEDFDPGHVRALVADSGVGPPAFAGDGTLMGEPILVVSQRSKAVEVIGEYRVFDGDGGCLATVRQMGQRSLKRGVRLFTGFAIFFTHRFEVTDRDGRPIGELVRPRKWFRSRVEIYDATGRPAGCLRQQNVFGHIRFRLEAPGGVLVATMRARNWRAWDFVIEDPQGQVLAEIVKSWEGWARNFLTTADRYVVRLARPLADPQHTLVVAAALAIDVALKQDVRGLNGVGA